MDKKDITEYTFESLFDYFKTNIDAVIAVNFETARFHTIRKSGFFNDFIEVRRDGIHGSSYIGT